MRSATVEMHLVNAQTVHRRQSRSLYRRRCCRRSAAGDSRSSADADSGVTHRLFTLVFTPARLFCSDRGVNFQKTTAPQAQTQFAAERCPLYPRKRTLAAVTRMSAFRQ